MTPSKETLASRGIFPYKGRGQHFLINEDIAKRIVDVSGITEDDVVLEIGPGTGALTGHLVKRAKRVVAVESDRKLSDLVRDTVDSPKLEVVFGDALKYDYRALGEAVGEKFTVVANLPYNISTPILFRLLDAHEVVKKIVLMLQREVALRLTASPGTKTYGALTVTASLFCDISIGFFVGRGNFYPRPKVDSAVVVFSVAERPRVNVEDIETLLQVIRAAFAGRRKTLRNALKPLLGPELAGCVESVGKVTGIDLGRRGETLSLEEFGRLSDAVAAVTTGKLRT